MSRSDSYGETTEECLKRERDEALALLRELHAAYEMFELPSRVVMQRAGELLAKYPEPT